MKLRFSKIDQENISLKPSDWKKENPADHYFFKEDFHESEQLFYNENGCRLSSEVY